MAVFSATLALCLGGLAVFSWSDLRQSPMATPSRKVLMLGVEAPSDAEWLEDRIFRTVGVIAIPRQYELVALQANPAANPFRATQLYITIGPAETNRYRLRMAIVRGSGQRHESSRVVSLREVDGIVNDFVADKLEGRVSRRSHALDEYVAARAYESRYAYASALDRYAKAVVQDPSWAEARVAYAERLHESGRTQEALAQLQALPERSSLSEDLRCRSVLLEIEIQNGREDKRCGPAATAAAAISDRNGEAALRALEYTQPDELDPLTWLEREHTAIYALVSEKHLDEAAARIADAKRVATSAGWLHAAEELGVYGAPLSLSRHDTEGANAIYGDGAAAMEALGDMDMALDMRIMALRIGNSRLGGETEAARSATRELIARARAVGNRRSESFALETELRFFRHDPVEWRKRYEQIRRHSQQYFGERERIQTEQRLLYYAIDMHAYAMVLAGVERIEASGVDDGQSRLWNGMLRANAQFAAGDVPGAVRSVLSMQKDDYDLRDADSCLLAWIFTEDARLELAEGMLRACPYASFDRDAHARYGYRGRYAQAKIFLHKGDAEAAWRTMRDGIDELMLRDQPTLAEYKAVAFLGAHALLLPHADLRLASAVLARVQPVARQETADLDLRLQTHLLEWRLCVRKQSQACGDILLHDAPEDGLELQLSRELLSTMTASRDDRSIR